MQNLSDKELDELFKNKFEDAAVAPPALLWPAIEKEIKPHSKPRLRIYRLAAAVAIVALVAGWLFTKEEKIQLQGKVAVVNPKKAPLRGSKPTASEVAPATQLHITNATPVGSSVKYAVKEAHENLRMVQPLAVKVHPPVKKATEKAIEVEVLPVVTTVVPAKAILIAQVPHNTTPAEVMLVKEEPTAKGGIRNVGDLVNFVVDKVDKREKKFLKFKTDDDDNSELVAINIGIIKFNPREK